MSSSQKLQVGLALEKQSEYMTICQCGTSHQEKFEYLRCGKKFFKKIQYPFMILKKILVKGEGIKKHLKEFPLRFETKLNVHHFCSHYPGLESTARQDQDSKNTT